jgi:hypothetical protein
MNHVEVKATATGHALVTIKSGEVVRAQANLDLEQATKIQQQIGVAIDKLSGRKNSPYQRVVWIALLDGNVRGSAYLSWEAANDEVKTLVEEESIDSKRVHLIAVPLQERRNETG